MSEYEVGMIGLGVMGSNLALNFASRGRRVLGFDRDPATAERLRSEHELHVVADLSAFVKELERPRKIVVLVPAGAPVDQVLDDLDPLLETDDVVVDAGNSHYPDTDRRIARSAERPWRFVGMGVSGGAEGARTGPAMMPGGDVEAWDVVGPYLEEIAARSAHGPCVAHCGRGAAGHFVKMVHNGIEYGDMQLIAETSVLLREGLELSGAQVGDTFERWNAGPLDSYLIAITADVFRTLDPEGDGRSLLLDAILDRAGQKGTGSWTVRAALDLGVAIPTITAAVDARALSSNKALRVEAERRFRPVRAPLAGVTVEDLEHALLAAKIASYSQGFSLLAAASDAHDYGIRPAEIARIWTAGCIIRARLLERIMEAFRAEPAPELLAFAFEEELSRLVPAWRRVVSAATTAGHPVPGLSASLSWFDTMTRARGSANVIQAQRDYFGSHTYERLDRPGERVHTDWTPG